MPHVLAPVRAPLEAIKQQLREDAALHARQGMTAEHVWQNDDDAGEVLFLFRVSDLAAAKERILRTHAEVRGLHADATLPQMTFLDGD